MSATILQADARSLPIPDASVDLILTSPPYWGLRDYTDTDGSLAGQVGAEEDPRAYITELVGIIDGELRRVLKPGGNLWLNLGDKYAASGGSGTTSGLGATPSIMRAGSSRYPQGETMARRKSKLGLPWRIAIALIDAGWILRAEVVWWKRRPGGGETVMPEPHADRVRQSHEPIFHLTLEPVHFAETSTLREPHRNPEARNAAPGPPGGNRMRDTFQKRVGNLAHDPLGRMPGSVWEIPTEPLIIPDEVLRSLGIDGHFAAFPTELARRIIAGWSPPGGTVLDPFAGTGTTPGVASAMGRHGIGVDLSAAYCALAEWRIRAGHFTHAGQLELDLEQPSPSRDCEIQEQLTLGPG